MGASVSEVVLQAMPAVRVAFQKKELNNWASCLYDSTLFFPDFGAVT